MPEELDFEGLPKAGIESLYKFKSFDEEGNYKDLLNNKLYLSSRTELNDPKDCRVPVNYELCTDDQLKLKMLNLLPDRYPEVIKIKIVESQFQHRKNNLEHYKQKYEKFIDNRIGVFSLTQELSEEMWKSYANNHTGFCIEIDAKKLFDSLKEKFEKTGRRILLLRVMYKKVLPEINPCVDTLDERAQLFLVKTKTWEDENEWRVVYFEGSSFKEPVESDCFKNIYFGLSASKENIETSTKILKESNPNIGLHKAVKKKDDFGLEFEKI